MLFAHQLSKFQNIQVKKWAQKVQSWNFPKTLIKKILNAVEGIFFWDFSQIMDLLHTPTNYCFIDQMQRPPLHSGQNAGGGGELALVHARTKVSGCFLNTYFPIFLAFFWNSIKLASFF